MRKALFTVLVVVLAAGLVFPMSASASPDTVTLGPNGPGDSTELAAVPSGSVNWMDVSTDDGDTTHVETAGNPWKLDLYSLADPSASGTINSLTVYVKGRARNTPGQTSLKTAIKTGGTTYYGSEETLTASYAEYFTTYPTNPSTSSAWTWSEVEDLQAGVALRSSGAANQPQSYATKVWVVVEYAPSAFEGLSHGFWKNHEQHWPAGYAAGDSVSGVFSRASTPPYVELGSVTLLEGLDFRGGETIEGAAKILLRQAIAAVLNAAHSGVSYPLTVDEIKTSVNNALDTQNRETILDLASQLDTYNNLGGSLD